MTKFNDTSDLVERCKTKIGDILLDEIRREGEKNKKTVYKDVRELPIPPRGYFFLQPYMSNE